MRSMMSAVIFTGVAMACAGSAHAQLRAAPVRAAYTVEPFTPAAEISIQGSGVRLRAEPFATADTAVLSHGSTGLPLTVVGVTRMPDWTWYQVVLNNGQKAFIRSDFTSAPSKGGVPAAQTPRLAAPLPPPGGIDYGVSSAGGTSTTFAATAPLSSPQPAQAYMPPHPPAPTSTPSPVHAPATAYAPPATQPSAGAAISLLPKSPPPGAASDNAGGLTSTEPR
jgi:hypothetical protein